MLKKYNYKGNLILQTARSKDNHHVELISEYKSRIEKLFDILIIMDSSQTTIVTGATKGIGKIALDLLSQNHNVVL